MEGLPKRKKHLKTFFSSHVPLKDGWYLPQGLFRKADSNTILLDFAPPMAKPII